MMSHAAIRWIEEANRHLMLGRLADAELLYQQALKVDQDFLPALQGMCMVRINQRRPADALLFTDRALALNAENEGAWFNRGMCLAELGRPEEALQSYDRSLQLQPAAFIVRYCRALTLNALGRADQALVELDQVLQLKPDYVDAWVVRAAVQWRTGAVEEALASYDRALTLKPENPEALWSRANCLWTRKQDVAGAIADLERLVAIRPDFPYARGALLHMRMHAGDWRDLARERAALDAGVRAGKRVVEPFPYLALAESPADLLASARIHTRDKFPPQPGPQLKGRRDGKIRVGYLCGEFRAQATMYLAAGLFEQHDRSRFHVTAFDNTPRNRSATRDRVVAAFDEFVSIQDLADREAAALIANREIDILVNLNGYFGVQRMGVFAHRPALLQVNYLGFPGSVGAEYMDYILADEEVIPAGEEQYYTEKVVRLPLPYQINDGSRPLPAPDSRAAHGLRETDFVFCHFNHAFKITPEVFDVWMRLLRNVPASVLWLVGSSRVDLQACKLEYSIVSPK